MESNYNKLKHDFSEKQNVFIKREQEMQAQLKKLHQQIDAVHDKELK